MPHRCSFLCQHVSLISCLFIVEFRLIVFRPFKGEIVEGQITSSSIEGIQSESPIILLPLHPSNFTCLTAVSLGFFDDIFIPGPVNLFDNTK